MSQNESEPIQNYLVRLRVIAVDCSFSCPSCEHDLSDIYIKDQIIRRVEKDTLQADLLAKAGTLKTLEQNVCHAEAFESASWDQTLMTGASDTTSAWLSTYSRQKGMPQADKGVARTNAYPNYEAKPNCQICGGCGSHLHGTPGTGSYQPKCPAWGQACSNCGKPNHLLRVCRAKKVVQVVRKGPEANEATMDTLITHITFNQTTGTYMVKDTSQIMEIEEYVIPFLPKPDPRQARDIPRNRSTKMAIFPDSGATICLGGLKHLWNMRQSTNNLIPSRKVIWAVGGFTLMCQGWLPVEFNVQGKTTKQALYICKKIQRLYFSKAACIDIGILPQNFPNPVATTSPQADMAMQYLPGIGY